jgi:C4-dicarboxylate-specific signal transduction histidine kinase
MPTKVVEKAPSLQELLRVTEQLNQIIVEKDKEIVKLKAQLAQAGKLATLGLQGAGIAHELNNPLTVISAEAEEILDAFDNDGFDLRERRQNRQLDGD